MVFLKLFGLASLCALAFTLCDATSAAWAKSGSLVALCVTLVLGPVGYLVFGLLNTRTDLAIAGGIVNALIIIFTALVGIFIFKQNISFHQIIGLLLIILGVILATYIPEPKI